MEDKKCYKKQDDKDRKKERLEERQGDKRRGGREGDGRKREVILTISTQVTATSLMKSFP
jgi:hypothetical protein